MLADCTKRGKRECFMQMPSYQCVQGQFSPRKFGQCLAYDIIKSYHYCFSSLRSFLIAHFLSLESFPGKEGPGTWGCAESAEKIQKPVFARLAFLHRNKRKTGAGGGRFVRYSWKLMLQRRCAVFRFFQQLSHEGCKDCRGSSVFQHSAEVLRGIVGVFGLWCRLSFGTLPWFLLSSVALFSPESRR